MLSSTDYGCPMKPNSCKMGPEKCPNIVCPKIVCPNPKVWDFDENRLHWASVVRGTKHYLAPLDSIALPLLVLCMNAASFLQRPL